MSDCEKCPDVDTYRDPGMLYCTDCPPGTYRLHYMHECKPCGNGTPCNDQNQYANSLTNWKKLTGRYYLDGWRNRYLHVSTAKVSVSWSLCLSQ